MRNRIGLGIILLILAIVCFLGVVFNVTVGSMSEMNELALGLAFGFASFLSGRL